MKTWGHQDRRTWGQARLQFAILFEDRFRRGTTASIEPAPRERDRAAARAICGLFAAAKRNAFIFLRGWE
ncbi:MAG: hypothetical protein H6719_26925 [Sandaracinaceae bacterium]|nr:hypothetical protein [Sandaracinaceae bacterium]